MSKRINYFLLRAANNGTSFIDFDLSYGTITSTGQEIVYTGTNDVDSIFVWPELTYDLTSTAGGRNKIYFTGNYGDYKRKSVDYDTAWQDKAPMDRFVPRDDE
jgi:hypothetical protein